MKSKTLKQMTDAQAIRIAEIGLAQKIKCPKVKRTKEDGVNLIFVFDADENYSTIKNSDKKSFYGWIEISEGFGVTEKHNALCNMDVIYDLLKFWGLYKPEYDKTGVWNGKGVKIPKTIEEVANFKS